MCWNKPQYIALSETACNEWKSQNFQKDTAETEETGGDVMYKLVRCPFCNEVQKTRGKDYFICDKSRAAYDIEQCRLKDVEEKVFRKPKKNNGMIKVRFVD